MTDATSGFYIECTQHGEDAEQYVVELSADDFALLRLFSSGDYFAFDGLLDVPPGKSLTGEQQEAAAFVMEKLYGYEHRADLRPSEVQAARANGRCLTVELY